MNVDRLLLVKLGEEREDFLFAGPVKAVAAFGFDRCGAVGGEVFEIFQRTLFEVLVRRFAKFFYGVANAAAFARDFFVGGAGDAHFVFGGAALGKNQVRVRVDKAGQDDAAVHVQLFGTASVRVLFDFLARPDGDDAVFVRQDRAVFKDAEVGESFAAARNGSAQRENLRCAGDEPVGHETRRY